MSTNLELAVGGMTCSSCAARVEKKLNRMPGVTATVNYATEKATLEVADDVTLQQLIDTVVATGYTAEPVERLASSPSGSSSASGAVAAGAQASAVSTSGGAPAPTILLGDALAPASGAGRADAAHDSSLRSLRQRVIISTLLTVPVMVLSMVPPLQFDNWQWLTLTLAAPVAVWGAWPFHRAAVINARHGAATMDTLVSIGVLAAFAWSLYALFFGGAGMPGLRMDFVWFGEPGAGAHELYLETAAAVTVFILAGRYAEARSKRSSIAAIRALLQLGASEAALLRDGVETRVPVAQLQPGDRFIVRPGEKIATDGVVVEGAAAIDMSMLTGEPVPEEVSAGDAVTGSTIATDGSLVVEATRVGSETALAQMAKLVEQAQSGKARVQRLADRISGVFVPIVLVLAVLTLAGWLLFGPSVEAAFTAAVATLIIACPCALGLATPMALLVGTARGSRLGILIKGPEVLESTRRIDTVLLDKTGTITAARMRVAGVTTETATSRDELLAVAAAVEHGSEHPIARAIVRAGEEVAGGALAAAEFSSVRGFGVRAVVDDRRVVAGRPAWVVEQLGTPLSPALAEALDAAEAAGRTAIAVGWNGVVAGVIEVADTVRSTSPAAVERLRAMGLRPVLATGDNERAARAVAAEVGIEEVHAGMTPEGKLDLVRELQAHGRVVAMVGDGVNDAAALAASDLGIAMGGGTDAAIQAGDLTLVHGDLSGVADAIRLSRRTLSTIKSNLFWAFAYNVAAIPVAMAGLLNPLLAGAAMAFSSVFVVSNSLRLRRFKPA
ncbi:heavy metal translocating P-type ATPase [Ruicaihuangia caeni]|uniref:heavy metal translocating P-type ATPase n=1 Tax=Ruicaihuangia caeni TaxID=3042517 RepID=UPI0033904972